MAEDVRRMRAALARIKRGRGKRLPAELRNQLGQTGRTLRSGGWSWTAIGKAIGVAPRTAQRISDGSPVREGVGFRRVEVSDEDGTEHTLTLVTPGGYRVEGLGVDDVCRLLALLR
jgi:hypothetical protein